MVLVLVLIVLVLVKLSSSSSGFDCGHYSNWEVIKNDTIIFDMVQQWLHSWQNQCDKGYYAGLPLGNGIGSDLIGAANWFEFAIENNKGNLINIYINESLLTLLLSLQTSI